MKIETIQDCYNLIENEETRQKLKLAMMSSFSIYFRFMFFVMNGKKAIVRPFMELIFGKLEDIVYQRNTKPNLLLNLSIGSGKSTIIQYFITWCFARDINNTFIYTSANDSLITRLSADTKYIIENEFFEKIFESKLKKSERAKINYSFDNAVPRTGLIAKTMRGALTGLDVGSLDTSRFTGALLIDDPLDAGDIRSEIKKEECKNIYKDKLSTRKRNFSVPTILIMQRLCKDDLAGYILEHEKDDWDCVIIPAFDENDNPTGIIDISKENINKILKEREYNPFKFYSQYQQKPMIEGGIVIKRNWFNYYRDVAELKTKDIRRIFMTADTAQKTKESNDYSVFCLWAVDNANIYLVDLLRGKWEFDDLLTNATQFWMKWHRFEFKGSRKLSNLYIEDKVSGTSLIQTLKRNSRIPILPIKRDTKDKILRLEEVLGDFSAGKVWLPTTSNFNDIVIAECEAFTRDDTHKHDDIIDNIVDALNISKTTDYSWIS